METTEQNHSNAGDLDDYADGREELTRQMKAIKLRTTDKGPSRDGTARS